MSGAAATWPRRGGSASARSPRAAKRTLWVRPVPDFAALHPGCVSAAGALHAGDECGVHVHLFAAASDQEPAAVGPDSAARIEGTGAFELVARCLAFRPDLLRVSRRGFADRAARED